MRSDRKNALHCLKDLITIKRTRGSFTISEFQPNNSQFTLRRRRRGIKIFWILREILGSVSPLKGWSSQGPWAVWPDVGAKSSPNVSKSYPRSRNSSSYIPKSEVFQNSPKSYQLFGLLLLEILFPRTFKNLLIWSHVSAYVGRYFYYCSCSSISCQSRKNVFRLRYKPTSLPSS